MTTSRSFQDRKYCSNPAEVISTQGNQKPLYAWISAKVFGG